MAAERKAQWVMVLAGLMLILALGLVAKVDWPLATAAQAIPAGIPAGQLEQFETQHHLEVYTLYYDFDNDGDIDIAYALDGPIRIIENRTAPVAVAAPAAP